MRGSMPAPADQRFRRCAIEPRIRPVDEGQGGVREKLTDRVWLSLHEVAIPLLALPERILRPLTFGNVGGEGLKGNDLAGVIEKCVEVTKVPTLLAVCSRARGFLVSLRMLGR